jgi:hypothetical protein
MPEWIDRWRPPLPLVSERVAGDVVVVTAVRRGSTGLGVGEASGVLSDAAVVGGWEAVAARTARLKWAALLNPQRWAIVARGVCRWVGSSRSLRQRSSRRCRIQSPTVACSGSKSLYR